MLIVLILITRPSANKVGVYIYSILAITVKDSASGPYNHPHVLWCMKTLQPSACPVVHQDLTAMFTGASRPYNHLHVPWCTRTLQPCPLVHRDLTAMSTGASRPYNHLHVPWCIRTLQPPACPVVHQYFTTTCMSCGAS